VNRNVHEQELPDAELVKRARRGSPAAFAELVSRYQDRVFNTCYRMCHNDADALDLTQSTFLRALEGLGRFQGRSQFYTWLFRIAINLANSRRRADARRKRFALDEEQCDAGRARDPADSVSRAAEQRELEARVEWALEKLDDEFRAAVVLKDIEDMDYASIAEILDVPIGTVKSRIHRGRLMLRDLLADERTSVDQARTR